ncbi:MAG: IS605 OrfB-like transposable element containing RNAse H-like and Zn finger domain [Candidatus Methanohalarchaeum thermophilum]|uniref:IS605 OrfB-like transposable element containing RNAse H-like and Zn finger domain n=1 Tax=Methanohalarchaeum thermophilum TaxID=1903181 RepID=A0A1Q6DRT8_METT1|nr:MAG: IS605 OrfB-like transposable element containing RNAse H-like and Zn finger domain [Candidatus Methanohalarchaeum thermophilum]
MPESTINLQMQIKDLSEKKKKRIKETIKKQKEIAQEISNLMPSIKPNRWSKAKSDGVFYRWVNKYFPENNGLRSHDANQCAYKVADSYDSWKQNGYSGEKPKFKDQNWCRFCNCNKIISYEQNNGKWGVKLPLEPYRPEWFRLGVGEYQEHYLTKEDKRLGDAEIIKKDNGFFLNQALSFEVEKERETLNKLGVDLGLNKVAVYVLLDEEGSYIDSRFFDGARVRHYRKKMSDIRKRLQEADQVKKVEELKDKEKNYIEQRNHFISKKIVDVANESNAEIKLENLSDIREKVNRDASKKHRRELNSWAFGELQSMIQYKAEMVDIPVTKVPARYTSQKCPNCSHTSEDNRKGTKFKCKQCGIEYHADFVGATNIANKKQQKPK